MITTESEKELFANDYPYDPIAAASSKLLIGFLLVIIGVLLISINTEIAGLFVPSVEDRYSEREYNFIKSVMAVTGGGMSLTGIALFLMYYLRHGFQLPPRKGFKDEILEAGKAVSAEAFKKTFDELSQRHSQLLNKIESDSFSLSEQERKELLEKLQAGITDQASKDILKSIEEKYSIDVIINSQLSHLALHYKKTTERLKLEIESLSRRGNLNLIIGSMTAVLGLFILGSMVFGGDFSLSASNEAYSATNDDYLSYMGREFLPRLSLVVLIEIFAYFFLRLYKASLDGIKFFQNELTNIESKFIGIEGAILSKDIDLKKTAIHSFVKTERNFILKKGESTVELERGRIDSSDLAAGLKSVSDIISAAKK